MQDRNPIEMLTDNNQDDDLLDPEMENQVDDDDNDNDDELDDDDDQDDDQDQELGQNDDVTEINSGNQPGRPYDPSIKLKNLTQVSHESNDSLRRRRKRAKVSKISGRNHLGKKKRRGDKDDSCDYSTDFDPRSETEEYSGYIQLVEGGHALMRSEKASFVSQEGDILVARDMVQRFGLRSGHKIHGYVRLKKNRRQKIVTHLLEIQDQLIENWRPSPMFHTLTSVNPFEFYRLSAPSDSDKSMVLLELLTPIGKGQRGLIVAPPRTGKTILMEKIANGIAYNHPEADIMVLLIDERPEEVTHLTRRVKGKIYASCLDKPIEEHIALTEMVIDIAQRKVEAGRDVVILLDSITRMSRAYNNQLKSSGRTLSGGVDAKALQEPKKFFGAARKLEEGGSLTIIATTLVQTGSQMDEVIFQEFKGTGNMELVLNRRLAEKRVYPAIDIAMSGTRREELILPPEYYKAATKFRRYLSNMTEANQVPAAIQALEKYRTTQDFVLAFA
jgi:transcription termination factor Rho